METVERLAYSIEEMAEAISIGRAAAYELIKQEGFPAVKIGKGRYIIPVRELKDWLKRQTEKEAT